MVASASPLRLTAVLEYNTRILQQQNHVVIIVEIIHGLITDDVEKIKKTNFHKNFVLSHLTTRGFSVVTKQPPHQVKAYVHNACQVSYHLWWCCPSFFFLLSIIILKSKRDSLLMMNKSRK